MAKRKKHKAGSWGALLEWCARDGKEKVLAALRAQHEVYESWEASAWADPATYGQARQLQLVVLKQCETL